MIRQTLFARDQAEVLFAHYRVKNYYQAHKNLANAMLEAADLIEAEPTGGSTHPKPYPDMAKWGFHWIKVHRYWFAWSMERGYPVVTNIFYDASGMWANVAPDEGEEAPFGEAP